MAANLENHSCVYSLGLVVGLWPWIPSAAETLWKPRFSKLAESSACKVPEYARRRFCEAWGLMKRDKDKGNYAAKQELVFFIQQEVDSMLES